MRRYEPGNQAPPAGAFNDRQTAPEPGHRKLIRPNLSELKDRMAARPPRRKQVPPEQTNAEAFYYLKQMNSKTPMVVVMKDGEELRGIIEWYDRTCIKVNRIGAPNLMVMKDCIKYMYKEEELRDQKHPPADGI